MACGPSPAADRRLDTLIVLGTRLDHPDALQLERAGSMLRGPAACVHDAGLGDLVAAADAPASRLPRARESGTGWTTP